MGRLKTGDRVLIAAGIIACLAAAAWFAWQALAPHDDAQGLVVVCQTKDGFYRTDPLAADTVVEYTVDSNAGAEEGFNTVRIADGTVEVTEADCSNQICVAHDPISQVGEQIVCLPHGLVIEVVAREEDAAELV